MYIMTNLLPNKQTDSKNCSGLRENKIKNDMYALVCQQTDI